MSKTEPETKSVPLTIAPSGTKWLIKDSENVLAEVYGENSDEAERTARYLASSQVLEAALIQALGCLESYINGYRVGDGTLSLTVDMARAALKQARGETE